MRYVIAATAFLVPLLLVISIGGAMAGGSAVKTRLGAASFEELRQFVHVHAALLDRYARQPGEAESEVMPHLALERFDRRGCDQRGQPWYRLALDQPGLRCGVLRRTAVDGAVTVVEALPPTLVVPLAGHWSYWEVTPPPPKSP